MFGIDFFAAIKQVLVQPNEQMNTSNDTFFVTAFYGIFHNAKTVENYFNSTLRWFSSLGLRPDYLGASSDDKAGNVISFSRGSKRLIKNGFNNISSLEVYAAPMNNKILWRDNTIAFDYEGNSNKLCAYMSVVNDIYNSNQESLNSIVEEMIAILKPEYGIGYHRPKAYGPGVYVYGVSVSPSEDASFDGENYEESLRINRWSDIGMKRQVYKRGYLRDLYPYNYLTQVHLDRLVDGITLKTWIKQNLSHGTLKEMPQGLTLWSVLPENIPVLRKKLREMGVIFDYKNWQHP